nr:hypothetical protein [Tanacetum cinerariifolium]
MRKLVRPLHSHRLALRYTSHHLDHLTFRSSSSHSSSDHSLSGHSRLGHSLSRHTPPDTIDADSSTPSRFVNPLLARTLWCSKSYLHWRSVPLSTMYPPMISELLAKDSSFESFAGISCKRCRPPAATVTSSIHATRALVPSRADLLPPHKRFRDSISPEDSVEEDIDTDVLEDIKADATTIEVVVDKNVKVGIDVGIGMEINVRIDVEDEVESNDRGTMDVGLDVVTRINIPDGMLMPNAVERLEGKEYIAGGERASLLEHVASLERSNARIRDTMMMERARADRFQRHMRFIESELRQIRRFCYYDMMRFRRLETFAAINLNTPALFLQLVDERLLLPPKQTPPEVDKTSCTSLLLDLLAQKGYTDERDDIINIVDAGIDVKDEVEDEVESSDRDTIEVEKGLQNIHDHVIQIPLWRIEDIETTQRQLEARRLIASRERAGLSDRTRSLKRETLKVRALLSIERDRVESLRRHMALSQEEFRQVRKDRDDTRGRLRRLESFVERRLGFLFGVDIPTTQSQPIESTQGMHMTTSAPRQSTPLTPPTLIPTTDEADDLILQDTIQLSIAEQKSHDELEAKKNVQKVKEHLIAEEIEKLVDGTKNVANVEVDSFNLRQDDNQIDLDTRPYTICSRDQEDPYDDAHPEGENDVKRQKTSEHGTYVYGESDSYAIDDDKLLTEKASQDLVDEMSQVVDEAKLRKNDVVWESKKEILVSPYPQRPTPVVQSCQRDPKALVLSLVNQDLLYLKKGSSGPKKIMMSLHKFPAVIFPNDEYVKKFNPYARYNVKH